MSSKSSSSQSSSQQDQRVGAEGEALAVGAGASVTIDQSSSFDENVAEAFGELVGFAGNALDTVKEAVKANTEGSKAVTTALAETRQLQDTGTTAASVNPVPIALALVGLAALYLFTKGK